MERRIHSNEGQFLQAFGCLVSLDFPYVIPSGHGLEHHINSKENQTVQESRINLNQPDDILQI